MEVINKAVSLMQYVYTITSNKKKYPPKFRILISRMQNICMDIYEFLIEANRIYQKNSKSERIHLQSKAITACDKLSCYAELSMNLKLLSSDNAEYLQKKISTVKYMTIGWRDKTVEK